jgi:hypothetical protein
MRTTVYFCCLTGQRRSSGFLLFSAFKRTTFETGKTGCLKSLAMKITPPGPFAALASVLIAEPSVSIIDTLRYMYFDV